ncbi:MAG: hypothetical protein QMC11_13030 [Rhodospirillales bacterium]
MGNDDFELPRLEEKPLPEEHAEYVIRRLEKFIRDGRTLDEGMSFRKWQFMAKKEIALAIAEAQNAYKFDEINSRRALFISAAALTTIGFWGTAISMERVAYLPGGIVCLIAGLTMLFVAGGGRYRRYKNRKDNVKRAHRLIKIQSLNKRVKALERDLEDEEKRLGKSIKKLKKLNKTSL